MPGDDAGRLFELALANSRICPADRGLLSYAGATAPLIDMVLVKFAHYPGATGLVPVFGVSDWIMVVFAAWHGVT